MININRLKALLDETDPGLVNPYAVRSIDSKWELVRYRQGAKVEIVCIRNDLDELIPIIRALGIKEISLEQAEIRTLGRFEIK